MWSTSKLLAHVEDGIPCNHAISVIHYNNMSVLSFVDPCYRNDTQLSIYGHHISLIRGVNQWTNVEGMEPILPPVLRRSAGRPNKKRRLEKDEVPTIGKVSKKGVQMTCTKCGFIKATSKSKEAFKIAPRSKITFKEKAAKKKQAKTNSPTTSKPTFYRTKTTSSKPAFYRAKSTPISYDNKVDDVYTRKVCFQPTSTSL
ncbi:hypothetical protein V6N13_110145 [Hibiscus sabdariffa]